MAKLQASILRLFTLNGWRGALVALLIGALIGLGQAPFSLIWIALPALIAAFVLFSHVDTTRHAFWRGWAVGGGYALITLFWIIEPFLVDVALTGWMAPFALIAMAAGFGIFWAGAFGLAKWISKDRNWGLFALAVAWVGFELLRSYALTGFPWGLVSYIWIDTPVLQYFAYFGPHGVTLLTLLICALVIGLWTSRRRVVGYAGVVIFLAAFVGLGWFIQGKPVVEDYGDGPIVRLIQPNADQNQKWDPAMMPIFYNRQVMLTAEVTDPPPDLIVWSEVAVPFLQDDPTAPFWEIAGAANGVPVILGAQRLDRADAYNGVVVLDAEGEITDSYDKHHLVPFGEYLPLGEMLSKIGLKSLTAQYGYGYSAGEGAKVFDLGVLGKALPLICYESIFPHEVRRVPERPDWLLLVTNDAWFGKLSGPYQHLAQARARSVEMGLPMVRVANTGISAMINARGKITGQIPLGVSGRIDLVLPKPLPETVYARFGDLPVLILLMLFGGVLLNRRMRLTVP